MPPPRRLHGKATRRLRSCSADSNENPCAAADQYHCTLLPVPMLAAPLRSRHPLGTECGVLGAASGVVSWGVCAWRRGRAARGVSSRPACVCAALSAVLASSSRRDRSRCAMGLSPRSGDVLTAARRRAPVVLPPCCPRFSLDGSGACASLCGLVLSVSRVRVDCVPCPPACGCDTFRPQRDRSRCAIGLSSIHSAAGMGGGVAYPGWLSKSLCSVGCSPDAGLRPRTGRCPMAPDDTPPKTGDAGRPVCSLTWRP